MTEAEWLDSTNVLKLVSFLRGNASDRKVRLFCCACCRLLWPRLPDARNRALVEAVEETPLRSKDDPRFWALIVQSSENEHEWRQERAYWAVKYLGRSFYKLPPLECTVAVVANTLTALGGDAGPVLADLLRDVIGNPFRPIRLDPSWLRANGRAAENLVAEIHQDQRWDYLPVLGDALEDAGCDVEELLTHCHAEKGHVRGCWAVDLLLRMDAH